MIRKIGLVILWGIGLFARAQDADSVIYRSPVDFPMLLSANFGELRPNHFHGGLDIKTQGVTGKVVRAVADGYISRVAVFHGGYGQAVYVTHPDGHTSVYGHVEAFSPSLQERVREYQYKYETFTCDLSFEPEEFPVKAGDMIALSGNEGSSAGPHLHLEIRRSDNGNYTDPLPRFREYLKDTKVPEASLIAFYPIAGQGVINGSGEKLLRGVSSLNSPVYAWGKIYMGISAKDYMDGTTNYYGVHSVTLYVDSVKVFCSKTDEFSADENRMINGFIDYDELQRTRRLIMRSYKSPGNGLNLLSVDADNGVITIAEERDYAFCYVLEDNFGNTKTYRFTVKGKRQDIPEKGKEKGMRLHWNRANVVQKPGMEFVIPKGMLYDDAELYTEMKDDSAGVSFDYVLDAGNTPLHDYCDLAIGVRKQSVADTTKYYIVRKDGRRKYSEGGQYSDGWVRTKVRNFGTFSVAVDTVPPRITPLGESSWRSTRNIRFRVSDGETGISEYKVYVDGAFVLFGLKKGILVIQDKNRVSRGKRHRLEVVVTDYCGNETREYYEF